MGAIGFHAQFDGARARMDLGEHHQCGRRRDHQTRHATVLHAVSTGVQIAPVNAHPDRAVRGGAEIPKNPPVTWIDAVPGPRGEANNAT